MMKLLSKSMPLINFQKRFQPNSIAVFLLCFSCFSASGVVAGVGGSRWSQRQLNDWYTRCKSLKPRRKNTYRVQVSRLGLSIKVPKGYYLIWKDPFKRRDGDVTIVNQDRYIGQQCSDEMWALHGVGMRGSTYGALLVYEGDHREKLNGIHCEDVVSFGSKFKVFCARAQRWTTLVHPITNGKNYT